MVKLEFAGVYNYLITRGASVVEVRKTIWKIGVSQIGSFLQGWKENVFKTTT